VHIDGLTAAQILGLPGTFVGASSFGATAPVSVTNGATIFLFDNTGAAVTITLGSVSAKAGVWTGGTTGDTNLDLVLNTDEETSAGATPVSITINKLIAGKIYTAQIFSINDVAGSLRQINESSQGDPADVSASFLMGDNVYVLGTFIATNTTLVIDQNEADGHGYMSAVIVRSLAPPPAIQWSGSNLQVSWLYGTLLEATNITGPWTTNIATSPYTVAPVGPMKFYRVQVP